MATSPVRSYINTAYEHLLQQQIQQRQQEPIYFNDSNLARMPRHNHYEPQETNESHDRYKKRNLKEYSTPEFSKIKDILPKHMVPHAVLCPKEDIKSRVEAYLTT